MQIIRGDKQLMLTSRQLSAIERKYFKDKANGTYVDPFEKKGIKIEECEDGKNDEKIVRLSKSTSKEFKLPHSELERKVALGKLSMRVFQNRLLFISKKGNIIYELDYSEKITTNCLDRIAYIERRRKFDHSRYWLISDLHFDILRGKDDTDNHKYQNFIKWVDKNKDDYFLFLGDYYNEIKNTTNFFKKLEERKIKGCFLLGNHEYLNNLNSIQKTRKYFYETFKSNKYMHFLCRDNKEVTKLGNISFIGDTGWTNKDDNSFLDRIESKFLTKEEHDDEYIQNSLFFNKYKFTDTIVLSHFKNENSDYNGHNHNDRTCEYGYDTDKWEKVDKYYLCKYRKLNLDISNYRFDISNYSKDTGYVMQGNFYNKKIIYKIRHEGFDKEIVDKMEKYYKHEQNYEKIYLYKNDTILQRIKIDELVYKAWKNITDHNFKSWSDDINSFINTFRIYGYFYFRNENLLMDYRVCNQNDVRHWAYVVAILQKYRIGSKVYNGDFSIKKQTKKNICGYFSPIINGKYSLSDNEILKIESNIKGQHTIENNNPLPYNNK